MVGAQRAHAPGGLQHGAEGVPLVADGAECVERAQSPRRVRVRLSDAPLVRAPRAPCHRAPVHRPAAAAHALAAAAATTTGLRLDGLGERLLAALRSLDRLGERLLELGGGALGLGLG